MGKSKPGAANGIDTKKISPESFPPLTPRDLEEIYNLFLGLVSRFAKYISSKERVENETFGFKDYTGTGQLLGQGSIYFNSTVTLYQFIYALAMTRHPLIKKMIEPKFNQVEFDPKVLADNKIMAGMKIIDLGSGPQPVFARCCRAMGADVWTVDDKPDSSRLDFRSNRDFLSKEQRDLEDQRHIELDLKSEHAADLIIQKSGGDFNLVTEANLGGHGLYLKEERRKIAWPLVKKGGICKIEDGPGELKE